MIVVVGQAWTEDEGEHPDASIALPAAFLDFPLASPGFDVPDGVKG